MVVEVMDTTMEKMQRNNSCKKTIVNFKKPW